jgi:hypothetical protein
MFKGIKKAVIRSRIESLLTSTDYGFLKAGYRSTGGKVAQFFSKFYNGAFATTSQILEADPKQVANMVAEAYEPAMNIVKSLKELQTVFEDHKPYLKELLEKVNEEADKWEKDWTPLSDDIQKDFDSIANIGKELNDKYLQ